MDTFDGMEYDDHRVENHLGGDETMGQPALRDRINVPAEGDWVTTGQAKKLLGVSSVNTVKRWAAEGKLEAQKVGANNWMRISMDSIRRLLRSGDENVQAFRRLKKSIDDMTDLDFPVTNDDLQDTSDRRLGHLPWEK